MGNFDGFQSLFSLYLERFTVSNPRLLVIFIFSKTTAMQTSGLLNTYFVDPHTWDEMYDQDRIREQYQHVVNFMQQLSLDELNKKEELAKRLFMSQGITFTVYNSGAGIEKIFPFDIITR